MQSEAVLCAPRLSLQYQSALCISNHIFGRMSIKSLPHFAKKKTDIHTDVCFFAFSFIFSFSPGAALLCCCRLHIILCLRVPQRCKLAVGSQKRCMRAAFHQPCVIKYGDGIAKDAAGQPMRNVNGRFALHKGIEAAVNLVLRNRIQKSQIFIKKSSFFSFRAFILFMHQKCKSRKQNPMNRCGLLEE
ncbi:MAG: hypothetical protein ACLU23_02700 [Eubacterium sp.]